MKRKRIILTSAALVLASLTSCVRINNNDSSSTKESQNVEDNSSTKEESRTETGAVDTTEETKGEESTTTEEETAEENSTTEEETTEESSTTVKKITITFINNGNTVKCSQNEGDNIASVSDPVKDGYTFKGWYLSEDGSGEAFDVNTLIYEDISLYAIFEKVEVKYTVSFDIDGTKNTIEVIENNKVSKPQEPVKQGYTFKGWYLNSNGNGNEYDFNTIITSDITLYAIFEKAEVKYTVSFDIDGTKNTVEVLENNKVSKPVDPERQGYVFKGWYENIADESSFDFDNLITSNITLYAVFEEVEINDVYGSYEEGLYIKFSDTSLNNVSVSYKKVKDDTYIKVDSNLIRLDKDNSLVRADIVGLEKGDYQIKYTKSDGATYTTETISVSNYDRSGYAHFDYASDSTGVDVTEGIGAYTNSGTLKSDTVVVYVTDETKNTVKATIGGQSCTGLVSILQAQSKSKVPLDVRIIGQISAATWNKIDYKVDGVKQITPDSVIGVNRKVLSKENWDENAIIKAGYNTLDTSVYSKLNGLTNKIKYDDSKLEFDSYYNMCDIKGASNVTVEGIGTDATIFQWGFTWKNSSSVEIRNLTFDDYTEDACSFEGSDDSKTLDGFKTGHIWIHNNQFNEGINYWDVCNEQDKHEGDGATDFKKNAFITLSYNHYIKNHKTGLVGGSDSQHTASITFHHNYYEECASRLPLARQANMHMYNNYYYKSSSYSMSIRANGYAFLENNYFEGGQNPYELKTGSSGNGYVKALDNIFDNVKTTGDTYYMVNNVTSRIEAITNTNLYGTTFDTDSSIFYYDSTNMVSKVENLERASEAKETCLNNAGVHKN